MQEGIANKANDVGISAIKTKLVLKRIMKRKDVEEDKKQDWEDKEQEGEMDKDNEENVNTIEFFIDGDNKEDATADESFDDPMEEDLEDKSNSQDGDKKNKVFGRPLICSGSLGDFHLFFQSRIRTLKLKMQMKLPWCGGWTTPSWRGS